VSIDILQLQRANIRGQLICNKWSWPPMPLTNTAIRNANPGAKAVRLFDE